MPLNCHVRAARDFLLQHRTAYEVAAAGFRWPDLPVYNFATEWFDGLAVENPDGIALWVIDGERETKLTFAELFALIAERPELGQPLGSAPGYLAVEALYAATHEGALHLDDILALRTRISIETWDRGVAAASEVAALVAPVLGWDEAQIAREVAHYAGRVDAERESQDQPDDRSADAARLGAPDVRMDGRS